MALKKSDLEGIREIAEISKILTEIERTITIKIEPSYDLSKVLDRVNKTFEEFLGPELVKVILEEKKEEAKTADTEAKEAAKLW